MYTTEKLTKCSAACGYCHGTGCTNSSLESNEAEYEDDEIWKQILQSSHIIRCSIQRYNIISLKIMSWEDLATENNQLWSDIIVTNVPIICTRIRRGNYIKYTLVMLYVHNIESDNICVRWKYVKTELELGC